MPTFETKRMIKAHINYGYILLEPTPANFELLTMLMDIPHFTTRFRNDDLIDGRTIFHRNRHALCDSVELLDVTMCELNPDEYDAAIADQKVTLLEAAE